MLLKKCLYLLKRLLIEEINSFFVCLKTVSNQKIGMLINVTRSGHIVIPHLVLVVNLRVWPVNDPRLNLHLKRRAQKITLLIQYREVFFPKLTIAKNLSYGSYNHSDFQTAFDTVSVYTNHCERFENIDQLYLSSEKRRRSET